MSWWDSYKKTLLDSLSKFPQYDPSSGGINPSGGPFIPQAPAPAAPPGTGYAQDVARPYGDVDTVASLAGVRRNSAAPQMPTQMPGSPQPAPQASQPSGSIPLRMLGGSFLMGRRNY